MENQEREISLGKLLWNVIFGWRRILTGALLFAVLLTGIFYIKDIRAYKSAQNLQLTEGEKSYNFTQQEQWQIQSAEILQQLIDKNEKYMKESILMNIDPYEENVLFLRFYVDSDYQFNYTEDNNRDYTPAVVAAYNKYTEGGELAQKILETLELDFDDQYIKELIQVDELSDTEVFNISVVYPDRDTLEKIADVIKAELSSQTDRISEEIGSHTLKLLSRNIAVRTDTELAELQKANFDMLNTYNGQLSALNATMTAEQLEKLAGETTAENGNQNADAGLPLTKPALRIKYLILGFVLGIVLAIIWITGRTLFSGRLLDSGELAAVYGLREFGILQLQQKISGLDKLLVKIKNRNKKQMTPEQLEDIVSSNIELYCKTEGIQQIYLTGTEIEHIDETLIQPLLHKLKQADLEVVYGENICYDAAALRNLVKTANVVLIEQAGMSKYQEIEKELRVISQQKVKILGCIGINTEKVKT